MSVKITLQYALRIVLVLALVTTLFLSLRIFL